MSDLDETLQRLASLDRTQLDSATPGKLIEMFTKLRDLKADLNKQATDRLAPVKELLEYVENRLLERMNSDDVSQFKNDESTASRVLKTHVRVKDWPTFFAWAQDHEAFAMLKRDVAPDAVRAFMEESEEVPPGIEVFRVYGLSVRKN